MSAYEEAFAMLVQAAVEGRRCPENDAMKNKHAVPVLAHMGWIRIEIYARNFRRVTILEGEHTGRKTARPPGGAKPWKVIDKNGTRHFGRKVLHIPQLKQQAEQQYREPWRPGQPIPAHLKF